MVISYLMLSAHDVLFRKLNICAQSFLYRYILFYVFLGRVSSNLSVLERFIPFETCILPSIKILRH